LLIQLPLVPITDSVFM